MTPAAALRFRRIKNHFCFFIRTVGIAYPKQSPVNLHQPVFKIDVVPAERTDLADAKSRLKAQIITELSEISRAGKL